MSSKIVSFGSVDMYVFHAVPAGVVHEDLKVFLMNNIPRGKKKTKATLGVSDPKLGGAIQETLEIQCISGT